MSQTKEQIETTLYNNYLLKEIMGYTIYYNGQYWWSLQCNIPKNKYSFLYLTPTETVGRTMAEIKTCISDFQEKGGLYMQIVDGENNCSNYKCSVVNCDEDEDVGATIITCSHKRNVTDDDTPCGVILFVSPNNNILGVTYGKDQAPGRAMILGIEMYQILTEQFDMGTGTAF